MPKGCIIYCIEQGSLERLTLLSIASIRRYGGELNQFDIYCLQPRKEFPISKITKNKLKELGVKFIDKSLNTIHRYYALINKPLVCDYIINNYIYDQYLFLDSDTFILDDPNQYFLSTKDIMLSPVNIKGVGISDLDDANNDYWLTLYKIAGVDLENISKVETVASKEQILPYWNSGVLLFNGQNTICREWKKLLNEILIQKIYPESEIYFTEQTCLTAVLLGGNHSVGSLPINCNYPVLKIDVEELKRYKPISIIHHYNNLNLLENRLKDLIKKEKLEWIQKEISEIEIYPTNPYQRLARTAEQLKMKLMAKLYYFIYKFSAH